MGSSLIFRFLYIKALNYRYFHTDLSTLFKNKKRLEKMKKTSKTRFYRKIKKRLQTFITTCRLVYAAGASVAV